MLSLISDFVFYMLFSSLEYFGLFLLTFSVFSLRFEYYWKEIIWLTLGFTLFSYLLVISNLYTYIPIPLIIVAVLTVICKGILGKKYTYCLVIATGSVVLYGFLQAALINLAVYNDVLTYSDTLNAFGMAAYMFQSLCAIISTTIALYIRHYYCGFGFSFYKSSNNRFVFASVFLLVSSSIIYLISLNNQTAIVFIISVVALIVSSVIIIYFCKKQDETEYS